MWYLLRSGNSNNILNVTIAAKSSNITYLKKDDHNVWVQGERNAKKLSSMASCDIVRSSITI